MMRYQRLSPECLPLPNGRKSTLKTTCKEDTNHHHHHHHDTNGRIPTFPKFESKVPLRVRSAPNTSTTSPDHHHHLHHFPPYPPSTPEPTSTTTKTHELNGTITTVRVDTTLPQWGHNKRSRGSRAESRSSGDDAAGQRRQNHKHPAKIQRRSVGGLDKQSTAVMPPPGAAAGSGHSRGSNPRACTVVSRDSASILHNRNIEERSTSISRLEKRSSSTAEKMHKPSSASHGHSATQVDSLNPSSIPSSEKEVVGGNGTTTAPSTMPTTEKLNLDLFEWPRIYLSLSRKEKEDDFLAMKGTKLPQRPKKRAKNIDKTLQYCFPGMWLSDLTRGRYEVREKKCVKKKKRGLKGMESMDSDSD